MTQADVLTKKIEQLKQDIQNKTKEVESMKKEIKTSQTVRKELRRISILSIRTKAKYCRDSPRSR